MSHPQFNMLANFDRFVTQTRDLLARTNLHPALRTYFEEQVSRHEASVQRIAQAHLQMVALYTDLRSTEDEDSGRPVALAQEAVDALVAQIGATIQDMGGMVNALLRYNVEETGAQAARPQAAASVADGRDKNVPVDHQVDPEPIRVPTPPPVDTGDLYEDPRRRTPPTQLPASTVPLAVMVRPETPAGDESATSAPAPVVGALEQPQDVVDERMEDIMSASSDSSATDESLRTIAEGSFWQWANAIYIVYVLAADTGNFIDGFRPQTDVLLQDIPRLGNVIQQQHWMTGNALERLVQVTVGLALNYSMGGHSEIGSRQLQAVAQRFGRQFLNRHPEPTIFDISGLLETDLAEMMREYNLATAAGDIEKGKRRSG